MLVRKRVPILALVSAFGILACDAQGRIVAGDGLGACDVEVGQCLDRCPDYPRILACPDPQVCDFRDGFCHAPAEDVLLANPARCGRYTCLAGTQCGPSASCILKPYAAQIFCDVVANCWGTVLSRTPRNVSGPDFSHVPFPPGEALDAFAQYAADRMILQVLLRRPDHLLLVTIDERGQSERTIPTSGVVSDAAIDLDRVRWLTTTDGDAVLYELSDAGETSTTRFFGADAQELRLMGRRNPFAGRGYCLSFDARGALNCEGQQFYLSNSNPITLADVFSRQPWPLVRREDLLNDSQEMGISAWLIARAASLSWAGSLGQELPWATLPAPVFSLARSFTGLVYASLVDGQVVELSSYGDILRVVMRHPGRRGFISVAPDGYLYFVAAGDVADAEPILDRVELPVGYF